MVDPYPNQNQIPSDSNYSSLWVQIRIDEGQNEAQEKEKIAEM